MFVSRFATAVARGIEPDVTPEDGVAVQAFIEAVYRSMELGTAVGTQQLVADLAS